MTTSSAVVLHRRSGPWRPSVRVARGAAEAILGYRRRQGVELVWRYRLDQPSDLIDRARIHADQATMAAIATGDEAAFARLVGELVPPLLRFTRATLAASPAEAEEVVQEALIRLWQQAATWQPDGRISTWLHRVAYRLCIDRLRRLRPSVDIDAVESDLADPAPQPGARMIRLEDARAVQARRVGAARAPAGRHRALPLSRPEPGGGRRCDGYRRGGVRVAACPRSAATARRARQAGGNAMNKAPMDRDDLRILDAGLARAAAALDSEIAASGEAGRVARVVVARVTRPPVRRAAWFAIAAALLLAAGLGSLADLALLGARDDLRQQVVVLDPLVFGAGQLGSQ